MQENHFGQIAVPLQQANELGGTKEQLGRLINEWIALPDIGQCGAHIVRDDFEPEFDRLERQNGQDLVGVAGRRSLEAEQLGNAGVRAIVRLAGMGDEMSAVGIVLPASGWMHYLTWQRNDFVAQGNYRPWPMALSSEGSDHREPKEPNLSKRLGLNPRARKRCWARRRARATGDHPDTLRGHDRSAPVCLPVRSPD